MLRLFVRFVGYWFLAGALVAAVVDGAKSIAASSLVLTPLAQSWALLAAAGTQAHSGRLTAPWPLGPVLDVLLTAPTVAVLAVSGFALLSATHRRHRLGQELAY